MELSPAQRVLAFLGIVVVLGGTGAYLLIPGVRAALGQGHPATPRPAATASRPAATATPPSSRGVRPGRDGVTRLLGP